MSEPTKAQLEDQLVASHNRVSELEGRLANQNETIGNQSETIGWYNNDRKVARDRVAAADADAERAVTVQHELRMDLRRHARYCPCCFAWRVARGVLGNRWVHRLVALGAVAAAAFKAGGGF